MIDKSIIREGGHDSVVLEELHAALKDGGDMLDVGANSGYFTVVAANKPGVRVLAFEPSTKELPGIYANLELNGCGNVWVYPVALGQERGWSSLFLAGSRNTGANSLVRNLQHLDGRSADCVVSSLCDLLSGDMVAGIRFCKIDVEGYEPVVIESMAKLLPQMRRCVFVVEITPAFFLRSGRSAREIYDTFETSGFVARFGLADTGQYNEVFRSINV
jgi:FkbM family methyltransferase